MTETPFRHATSAEIEAALQNASSETGKIGHLAYLYDKAATDTEEDLVIELARVTAKNDEALHRAITVEQVNSRGNYDQLPNLRKVRKERGLSVRQLGETVGTSGWVIHEYEKGNHVSGKMQRKLGRALGVSVNVLRSSEE